MRRRMPALCSEWMEKWLIEGNLKIWLVWNFPPPVVIEHNLLKSCDRSKHSSISCDWSKLLSTVVIIIGQILFHHWLLNVIPELYMKRKQRISIVKIAIEALRSDWKKENSAHLMIWMWHMWCTPLKCCLWSRLKFVSENHEIYPILAKSICASKHLKGSSRKRVHQ